eukprot:CAMPEP_0206363002 /NCGR_PEP_ID=MMETSP0294-20121207/1325_1 /ASSEMBLY_ACC=CAM_ASM_000327 /TAXON_ID=39354 /ORGANISM="Heterosigma akashiwo, Strain CCMP2393" /LENGTH=54 /DNA_ID=CAMNT_0053808249 /DNA_START=412 /DNA_END=576 /DNA_ORIENTATION=-
MCRTPGGVAREPGARAQGGAAEGGGPVSSPAAQRIQHAVARALHPEGRAPGHLE